MSRGREKLGKEYPQIVELFPVAGLLDRTHDITKRDCLVIQGTATVRTVETMRKTRTPIGIGELVKTAGEINTYELHIGKNRYPSIFEAIERRDALMPIGEILRDLNQNAPIRRLPGGFPDVVLDDVLVIEKPKIGYLERVGMSDIDNIAIHYVKKGNPKRTDPLYSRYVNLPRLAKTTAASNLGVRIEGELAQKVRSTLRSEYVGGVADKRIIGGSPRGIGDLLTSMLGDRPRNFDRDVACYHPVEISLDGIKKKDPVDVYQLMFERGFIQKTATVRHPTKPRMKKGIYTLQFNGGFVAEASG